MKNSHIPKVTVVIRTQNRILLLQRAIQSLINQEFKDWNAVIVNDGGNEKEIYDICLKTSKSEFHKFQFIHNEKSLGRSFAVNQGFQKANTPYLAILDDDDTWEPKFLTCTVQFLEQANPKIFGAVRTQVSRIYETIKGNSIVFIKKKPFHPRKDKVSLFELAQGNFIPFHSVVFRKEVLDQVGGIDDHLPYLEDWDFFLRLVQKFEIETIPLELANYHFRVNKDDQSPNKNSVIAAREQCVYYENYLRNKYLRQDLQEGKMGLGFLMNMGAGISQLSLWNCLKNDLKKFLKKIKQRV